LAGQLEVVGLEVHGADALQVAPVQLFQAIARRAAGQKDPPGLPRRQRLGKQTAAPVLRPGSRKAESASLSFAVKILIGTSPLR